MKTVHRRPGNRPAQKRIRTPGIQPGETVVTVMGHQAPRLPHERDESSSSQESPPREEIKQAYKDVEAGIVDDDVSGPMDQLYQRAFRGHKGSKANKKKKQ